MGAVLCKTQQYGGRMADRGEHKHINSKMIGHKHNDIHVHVHE